MRFRLVKLEVNEPFNPSPKSINVPASINLFFLSEKIKPRFIAVHKHPSSIKSPIISADDRVIFLAPPVFIIARVLGASGIVQPNNNIPEKKIKMVLTLMKLIIFDLIFRTKCSFFDYFFAK